MGLYSLWEGAQGFALIWDVSEVVSKVCRLVWDYPTRGQSSYGLQPVFVNISEEQVRQGYEVHVIAKRNEGEPREEFWNGVHVHRVSPPFTVSALDGILRMTYGSSDWVVHTHATCGFFLTFLRRFRQFPLVTHVHGSSRSHYVPIQYKSGQIEVDYSPFKVAYSMLREKMLWSSADKVLAVSKATANDIIDSYGVKPETVRVVYNGVDTHLFFPAIRSPCPGTLRGISERRVILFVGHFGVRKGVFHLIRAMRLIKKEVPDSHLVCVGGVPSWLGGKDYWGMLKSEIAKNDLEGHVTLMDAVTQSALVEYYRFARVFALPSYYESFSKAAAEAMACGKPVVATKKGGLEEVVCNGHTGELVGYGAVNELAASLTGLLQDESRAVEMGRRGRERVEQLFTWKAVVKNVSAAYKELESRPI